MITLYSTNCPKCKVVELKLQQKHLEYQVIDDVDAVLAIANEHEIESAPFIEKDGVFYTFSDAIKIINEV